MTHEINPPPFSFIERKDFLNILYLFVVFLAAFILLTPFGNQISFLPPSQEAKGIYNILHIDEGDDAGYYTYLRSLFFDQDIDFFDEPYYAHKHNVTDTGYIFNQWKIGPAILWFPFYLLAHGITKLYNFFGIQLAQDGLSMVYFSITALASATYIYFGLILNYFILRRWLSSEAAFAAVLLFFLATPLIYYTFIRSRMAHANDYFLICLFTYSWLLFRDNLNRNQSVFLGLIGGTMLLTRVNSAGFLLLPFLESTRQALACYREKIKIPKEIWINLGIIFAVAIFVYSIQLSVNLIISGNISPTSQSHFLYSMLQPEEIALRLIINPLEVFIGMNWGLLWHAPVYIAGFIGFGLFINRHWKKENLLLAALFPPVLLTLIWPHHGLSFGYRHLLTANLLLSLGLGCIWDMENRSWKKIIIILVSFLTCFWMYIQLCLYKIVIPHDSNAFILTVFKTVRVFSQIPELLLRGENLIFLWSHPRFEIKTDFDQFALFVYPFLQGTSPLILLFTAGFIWDKIRMQHNLNAALKSINKILFLFFLCLHILVQVQSEKKTPELITKRKSIANPSVQEPAVQLQER